MEPRAASWCDGERVVARQGQLEIHGAARLQPMDTFDEASSATVSRSRRYRRAGGAYAALGTLVILVTLATPEMVRPELRGELVHAWIGQVAILLFAALIAWGDRLFAFCFRLLRLGAERARRWGEAWQTWLARLLTLSALGRLTVFLGNGVGQRPRVRRDPWHLALEAVEAQPRMLLCALLIGGIVWVLIRLAWWPPPSLPEQG